jgi:FkbM family methyltransferase
MDKNIINVKHISQNLNYVFFWYSSSFKYKMWYIITSILKPYTLFKYWSIKNNFPFPWKYIINNFYWKFEILEPSDMHWILSPYSEKELTEHFISCKEWIFLDIWTNIWKYSIKMAKNWMQVYSFEPNPIVFNYLINNIKLNNLEEMITPINFWIWEQWSFQIHIPVWNNYGSWTIVKESLKNIKIQESLECKIEDIWNLIKKYNIDIKNVRLIKIDTEWAELSVITSFIPILKFLKNCKIIIEIDTQSDSISISNILKKYWFNLQESVIKNFIFIKK